MKKFVSISIVLLALVACTPEGRIFEKHKDLSPDLEWRRSDVRSFDVPIEDTSKSYRLSATLRYVSGYPWTTVPLKIDVTSPSGISLSTSHDLIVRDSEGNYIGEAGLDIWDSMHTLSDSFPFDEQGMYHFDISHNGPDEVIPFLMEIGLVVDDIELMKS